MTLGVNKGHRLVLFLLKSLILNLKCPLIGIRLVKNLFYVHSFKHQAEYDLED